MARRSLPTPITLQRRAFSVAEALEAGMTRRVLENSRFRRPHYGVCGVTTEFATHEFPGEEMRRRALDYLPLLRPGEAFSHTSALLLFGTPIHTQPLIHVTAPLPTNQARGRHIRGHRSGIPFDAVLREPGLPCVPPEMALLQVMSTLEFRELVVAVDSLVLPRGRGRNMHSLLSLQQLRIRANVLRGRGIRRLRVALELARVGAESRMETLVRYELALLGIFDLEPQVNIFDEAGAWIGRFDLVDRERKRIVEYDGEQHRLDRAQYLKDQDRLSRAWRAGYEVLRLGKENFAPGQRPRTRRELCEFLGREPRPVPAYMRQFLDA